jgi:hypothetical protein
LRNASKSYIIYITYKIVKELAIMAIDQSKNAQILLTIPHELKEKIEDYRFENRIQSRNAAILELIKTALELNKQAKPTE